ncbi:MBL fold metallo-hydrolase [Parahaliea mediterranea]|uniref:MBL fold metallo-hydrolase n=1 Tax=Parahaliea mediterranea TaxID=651086 RepID=UPI001473A052|nr:MBL fold metallo-hydrolase [Parahaliea mediterranea]
MVLQSLVFTLAVVAASGVLGETSANTELMQFHRQFDREAPPVEVSKGVYAFFGTDYANFSVVEGDDGLIVIDTGWLPDTVRPPWETLASQLKKPVKAIVYTHVHGDHFGGSSVFMEKATDDVAIYAPEGWQRYLNYLDNHKFFLITERVLSQMGSLLEEGPQGTIGSGIGPSPRLGGQTPDIVSPTVSIGQHTTVTIAGVRVEMIPAAGDIASHMMVWLPEQKVLFSGDTLGGTLPFMVTPRFEPEREPQGFIDSLAAAMSLHPEVVVPGHGRILLGADDVDDVLQANIDVIRYLSDQVFRLAAQGKSADQMIDQLKIPEPLASHPDLQPYYHRLDWLIRGATLKVTGFASDITSLTRLTQTEEDRRLFALAGGTPRILKAAKDALDDGEARWALSLATRVLDLNPADSAARDIRLDALHRIAAETRSAAERNYLLTRLKDETQGIDWDTLLSARAELLAAGRDSAALLADMRYRYRVENASEPRYDLAVTIKDEADTYVFEISPYALAFKGEGGSAATHTLSLHRGTLIKLWARSLSWREAMASGAIEYSGPVAQNFASLID